MQLGGGEGRRITTAKLQNRTTEKNSPVIFPTQITHKAAHSALVNLCGQDHKFYKEF